MSFMHYHTDLESVQDLTRDTVISIVSDALKVPATRVTCTSRLREDLGMTRRSQARLKRLIMTYFDDLVIDLDHTQTVQDILDHTLRDEMDELAYDTSPF